MPRVHLPLAALFAAGATACDAQAPADLAATVALVRGAPFQLDILPLAQLEAEVAGWSDEEIETWIGDLPPVLATSSAPLVFDLDAPGEAWDLSLMGVALTEGAARLDYEDPWTGPGAIEVIVGVPDRAALFAFDTGDAAGAAWVEQTEPPKVLVDGVAQFEIRPFQGDLALRGAHVLEIEAGPGLETEVVAAGDFDAVNLRARAPGLHEITLFVAGEPVGVVSIEAVDLDAAATLRLVPVGEPYPREGETATRAARVEAADGSPIFGALPTWTIDGEEERGDTLRFALAADGDLPIRVRLGDLEVEASLPALEADVYTSRAGGGALDPLSGLLALGLGALVLGGRRHGADATP